MASFIGKSRKVSPDKRLNIFTSKAVSKLTPARQPRFELHLKIYDLNNVPLVSGGSFVKWQLPHSLHSDHRGRTQKRLISNHRVDYNYAKIIPIRLVIDRHNRLSEYPIEFEVFQEFDANGTSRDEKILLGKITLNLAEYVAESEAMLRDVRPGTADSRDSSYYYDSAFAGGVGSVGGVGGWHSRKRSSLSMRGPPAGNFASASHGNSAANPGYAESVADASILSSSTGSGPAPPSTAGSSASTLSGPPVEDGVTRRYLMQDSKINSTLKISILMVQMDGERNFIAPPLKSAAVFGGIAGILASGEVMGGMGGVSPSDDLDDVDSIGFGGLHATAGVGTSGREASEIQDVYRRALAASWACQAGELPADECIEDIFSGGSGFRDSSSSAGGPPPSSSTAAGRVAPSIMRPSRTGGEAASEYSVGSMQERTGWSSSSPTRSMATDRDIDDLASSAVSTKKASRILPRLPPIRRHKKQSAETASERRASKESQGGRRVSADSGADILFESGGGSNSSSGEDAGFASGSASGSASASVMTRAGGEDALDAKATLRPRDLRKLQIQPAAASTPALVSPHDYNGQSDLPVLQQQQRHREDLSETQSRGGGSGANSVHTTTSLRRDNSYGSALGSLKSRRGSSEQASTSGSSSKHRSKRGQASGSAVAGTGGGDGRSGSHGGEPGDQLRRVYELDEFDVRDDFVAWQLPGSITTTAS